MYGPHYVWIFTNSNNNGWWIPRKGENIACSDLEMKCQVQNHFSFYHTNVILPKGSFYDYANKVSSGGADRFLEIQITELYILIDHSPNLLRANANSWLFTIYKVYNMLKNTRIVIVSYFSLRYVKQIDSTLPCARTHWEL